MKENLKKFTWENLKDSLQTKGENAPCLKNYKFESYDHDKMCSLWLSIEYIPNWLYPKSTKTLEFECVFSADEIFKPLNVDSFEFDFNLAFKEISKYNDPYIEV